MKISPGDRRASVSSIAKAQSASGVSASRPAAPAASVNDSPAVLGIPPADLTPRVREVLMTLMSEVESLRQEVERSHNRILELEKLADSDTLSPIANRRAFVRELLRVMSYAERHSVKTSILFFDVNDLKKVNDRLGHAAGDQVLIHVADTLRANVRASDVVGRLGGDEYAVLLTHADEGQAHLKADQLANAVRQVPVRIEGQDLTVSVAVGVYTFGPGENPTDVLSKADKMMYAHKKALKEEAAAGT